MKKLLSILVGLLLVAGLADSAFGTSYDVSNPTPYPLHLSTKGGDDLATIPNGQSAVIANWPDYVNDGHSGRHRLGQSSGVKNVQPNSLGRLPVSIKAVYEGSYCVTAPDEDTNSCK